MYLADLNSASGCPVVRSSKVLYQTENARPHHAAVRKEASAHDGRVVGGTDHPDSYAEFTVFAASAGAQLLTVRFANGSRNTTGAPVTAMPNSRSTPHP